MQTTSPHEKFTTQTTVVIFGITGDLAKRKLIPALWRLFTKGYLPNEFSVVGFARREWSDASLQALVITILTEKFDELSTEQLATFSAKFSYTQGDFNSKESYDKLASHLTAIDDKTGICSSKVFHLAVPPDLYEGIFTQLHASGLADKCADVGGWTRILVEKPFGNDWYSAEALDQKLGSLFREEQVFRVDHYMGKEAIQNILAFRFSNSLLEHLWNSTYIERVHIRLWEKLGTEGRGAFYDNVGALRDVGQNHILQMLAFVAMEDPVVLQADAIRRERAKVLGSLHLISKEEMPQTVLRAQYEGYRDEDNVNPSSQTETYFRVEAHLDNPRWKGVPFVLESGKALGEAKAEIEIVFKKKDSCLCGEGEEIHPQNTLTFRIQPQEEIAIRFFAKHPGFEMKLEPKVLSFSYGKENEESPDAYERVIFDCIAGDQTLFASTAEVLGSWKFITPIIEQWNEVPVHTYKVGWVPE